MGLHARLSGSPDGPTHPGLDPVRNSPGREPGHRHLSAASQWLDNNSSRAGRLRRWDQRRPVSERAATASDQAAPHSPGTATAQPQHAQQLPGANQPISSTAAAEQMRPHGRDHITERVPGPSDLHGPLLPWAPNLAGRQAAGSPPRVPLRGPHLPPRPAAHLPTTSSAPSFFRQPLSFARSGGERGPARIEGRQDRSPQAEAQRPGTPQRVTSLEEEVLMDLDDLMDGGEEEEAGLRVEHLRGRGGQRSARAFPFRFGSDEAQLTDQQPAPAQTVDGCSSSRYGNLGLQLHSWTTAARSNRPGSPAVGPPRPHPHPAQEGSLASSFHPALTDRQLRRRTGVAPDELSTPPWVRVGVRPPPHYEAQPVRGSPAPGGEGHDRGRARGAGRDSTAERPGERGAPGSWMVWGSSEVEEEEQREECRTAAAPPPPAARALDSSSAPPQPPGLSASLQTLRDMLPRPVALHPPPGPRNLSGRSNGSVPPRPPYPVSSDDDDEAP
jgi:hypothetical protein